jgi:recombination protein RecA
MIKKKQEKEAKTLGKVEIEDTLNQIRTKFGDEAIMKLGDKPHVDVDAIPTGSIGLDAALGVGGLPQGRIIEIFGPESSGKTTLALHVVAEAQKKGGICAYIDAEHAMDPEYATKLGVNINDSFDFSARHWRARFGNCPKVWSGRAKLMSYRYRLSCRAHTKR